MKHLHPYWHSQFQVGMNYELSIFNSIRGYYDINKPSLTRLNIIYDI